MQTIYKTCLGTDLGFGELKLINDPGAVRFFMIIIIIFIIYHIFIIIFSIVYVFSIRSLILFISLSLLHKYKLAHS